jgi:pimeloyl-ACP methyl ester carboxylesterase
VRYAPAISLALVALVVTTSPTLTPRVADAQPSGVIASGKTLDFVHDGHAERRSDESYEGRVFVTKQALGDPDEPRPLVVFLHGTNPDYSRFRMVGGRPQDPDLRQILGEMVEQGDVPPLIVGAPTTTVSCIVPESLWPNFDLDRFIEGAATTIRGVATIDLTKVIVVGHSGGACNRSGGIFRALAGTTLRVRAVMSIDTCMDPPYAESLLALSPPETDVYSTWQPLGWSRAFDKYVKTFEANNHAPPSSVRVIEEMHPPMGGRPHDQMVALTLKKYLPQALRVKRPKPE